MCIKKFRNIKDNQSVYLADLRVRPKCSKYTRSTNSNGCVAPCMKIKTSMGQELSLYLIKPYGPVPVPTRDAQTI